MNVLLCGFDEAGRGPLAGPVVAAAVILPEDFPIELLNDSKQLSEKKRLAAETVIKEKAIAFGIGQCSHTEIDEINILQASLLAMKRAFIELQKMLQAKSEYKNCVIKGITDGTFCPEVPIECRAEPKADGKYPCVMAASILAKNFRDSLMKEAATLYPQYGYEKHKGYPTKDHKAICHELGPSPIQRLSFKY